MVRKISSNKHKFAICAKCLGITPHEVLPNGDVQCRYCEDIKKANAVIFAEPMNRGCSPKSV